MVESDRDHSSEMEARLDEKHHRWLRPEEICDILRNPNRVTISEEPAIRPPSGSIFLFDKNLQKHFRNDLYKWKKAKGGRTKEAHEKLKVEGVDVLHCYYAHREDVENFQRRIYWMIDKNLSHRVFVHYRDVKEDQITTGKGVLPSRKTDASAYNHQASSGLPLVLGLEHKIASSSSNPTNFQHSQATNVTNLNSAQTSEPETTIPASNHQASFGLPYVPGFASSISNPSNFQHSQATDAINFQEDDNWLENLLTDPSDGGILENHQASFGLPYVPGFASSISNPSNFQHSQATNAINFQEDDNWLENLLTACTNSRASSSAAVQPSHSSLGKRQCDSTKSKATPLATIEEVDEEEEGNDTNQARKRLKVTCGQKSIATSTATNITAAPESSSPAVLQSRPTSDANQDFVQDVENQEQELEPSSIEPENGKSKVVVQNDFWTGKSHEFSQVAVMDSCKSLRELLDRASAPNTLASSSISTPARDSQAIATIRTFLEMNFTTMAGDVKRTDKISLIKRFVDSNCLPTDSRTRIWQILEELEQPLQAYSEYDKGKNLNAQVEDMIKRLQPKVQFCNSKKRDLQRLENEKMQIEADQAVIRAEIDGAVKETEPIQAELRELLPQRDQFKENEANLKISLVFGEGYWKILKEVILRKLDSSYSDIHDQEILDSLSGVNAQKAK